jgi:hypothetical protein
VSYEIFFVRRDPGQSFDDALEETEDGFEGDPGPLSAAELEQWDEVLPVARDVLGDVQEFGDETTRELTNPATGVQLSLFNGEMAIRVPYGDFGEGSVEVMSKVYELARAIERLTGLEGYDPQLEEAVSDSRAGGEPQGRSRRSGWEDEDDDGESTGTSTTLPPARPRRELQHAGGVAEPRRWWEFWKR